MQCSVDACKEDVAHITFNGHTTYCYCVKHFTQNWLFIVNRTCNNCPTPNTKSGFFSRAGTFYCSSCYQLNPLLDSKTQKALVKIKKLIDELNSIPQ